MNNLEQIAEEIIWEKINALLEIHELNERMTFLSILVGHYFAYKSRWSGNSEVEQDAFVYATEKLFDYYKEKYAIS